MAYSFPDDGHFLLSTTKTRESGFFIAPKCLPAGDTMIRLNNKVPFHVYAVFCEDDAGKGYVKIGRTSDLLTRLATIRTGCPFEVKYIAFIDTGFHARSVLVERQLQASFQSRRTRGEWFRFDFRSPDDKKEFSEKCRSVFRNPANGLSDSKWTKMQVSAIDAAASGLALPLYRHDQSLLKVPSPKAAR
jgi:hypothetical protein